MEPEISNLLRVSVSSEATGGPGSPPASPNVHKKKWETLDLSNGSKNRITNSTLFRGKPQPARKPLTNKFGQLIDASF